MNLLAIIVSELLSLALFVVLMRLLLQLVRADFRNPICQAIVRLTNPLVIPLRRLLPPIRKLDTATVDAWNTRMRTREKPVPLAAEERKILGITDESERRGVLLNDLIDWHLWHMEITK